MPSTWPPEALKAQAVVARSYALAMRKTTGAFDVYADTRSQVYGGIAAEKPAATAAVDATAGQVLLYDGQGRDDVSSSRPPAAGPPSIEDVLELAARPVSRLGPRPVRLDLAVPRLGPGLVHARAKLAKALKVPGRLLDVQTTLNSSGRVSEVDRRRRQGRGRR